MASLAVAKASKFIKRLLPNPSLCNGVVGETLERNKRYRSVMPLHNTIVHDLGTSLSLNFEIATLYIWKCTSVHFGKSIFLKVKTDNR